MSEKNKNPWTTINSNLKYENNWISVTHHEVINASNNPGIYGTVHFKNIAIGILPVDEENHTWLIGQWRYPLNCYSWEIPEGGGKIGIDPILSAKRELAEETGISADSWKEIQRIHTSNSVSDELGILYLAEDLSFSEPNPDEDEELVIKKCKLSEALKMVLDGEITDSLSVAAILKLKVLHPEKFDS